MPKHSSSTLERKTEEKLMIGAAFLFLGGAFSSLSLPAPKEQLVKVDVRPTKAWNNGWALVASASSAFTWRSASTYPSLHERAGEPVVGS